MDRQPSSRWSVPASVPRITGRRSRHWSISASSSGCFRWLLLTGTALFMFGFMGMWCFAALDAWRTAQIIRSGLTPDVADDVLVKRFSGNPKLWGIVLSVLGGAFFFQAIFPIRGLIRGLLPLMLIGFGIYVFADIFSSQSRMTPIFGPPVRQPASPSPYRYNEADYRVSAILPTVRGAAVGKIYRLPLYFKESGIMLKAAGVGGSILVMIALVITLLKALVGFVGFISLAIKIVIVLAFLAVFAGVGFLIFRGYQNSRRRDYRHNYLLYSS